jgi:glutamyl-tRNA synthetase
MPDEGVTGWEDGVRGRIEFPNEQLDDLVIVRSDGRATYNFANPVEDMDDAITHVIRGRDHVSNTPKQLQILSALGHEPPVYAHVPDVLGDDGKKLSKRHGATSVDEFRTAGYIPPALMKFRDAGVIADALVNYLALVGWSFDDHTNFMTRAELVERFTLERVGASPATLDYQKLDWLNGTYLRALPAKEYADVLVDYLREQGYDWPEARIRAAVPLVQEKIERLGQFPDFAGFLFSRRNGYDPKTLDAGVLAAAEETLAGVEPFTAEAIEQALRALAERVGQKPRQAFQPIRVAVTGSTVSPGLFESIELLGRDETLARIRDARTAAA